MLPQDIGIRLKILLSLLLFCIEVGGAKPLIGT